MSNPIQLIVHGAAGRMGRRVVALAADDANFQLIAAVDHQDNPLIGQDAGLLVVGDRDSALLGEGRVSSKHAKARSQIRKGTAILIISESEWLELVNETLSLATLEQRWGAQAR